MRALRKKAIPIRRQVFHLLALLAALLFASLLLPLTLLPFLSLVAVDRLKSTNTTILNNMNALPVDTKKSTEKAKA